MQEEDVVASILVATFLVLCCLRSRMHVSADKHLPIYPTLSDTSGFHSFRHFMVQTLVIYMQSHLFKQETELFYIFRTVSAPIG